MNWFSRARRVAAKDVRRTHRALIVNVSAWALTVMLLPTCLVVACARQPVVLPTRATPAVNEDPDRQPRVAGVRDLLAITPLDPGEWRMNRPLTMDLRWASIASDERLEFQVDTVTLHGVGGDEVVVSGGLGYPMHRELRPQLAPTVHWIIDGSNTGDFASGFFAARFTVRPSQTVHDTSIAGRVASVTVAGTMTLMRSRVIASLPLRVGARTMHNGVRIDIIGFSHDDTGIDVWIQTAGMSDIASGRTSSTKDAENYAIFNAERSEAILVRHGSQMSSVMVVGGEPVVARNNLVLQPILLWREGTEFTTKRVGQRPAALPRDDAWYASARFVVLDWEVVDRYPVRSSARVTASQEHGHHVSRRAAPRSAIDVPQHHID